MSNPIKYTTGSESLALNKGNFYIGTGDVGKGPTSTTGYYNGIDPPTSGYTIYLNKASGGPSIYTASNDSELISLTNSIASQSYTTVNECLNYFNGQTDKLCVNRNYEGIVTDGLVFNLDAGFTPSYPKNGTTWYDVLGSNNGTLYNGTTFDTGNGGSIVFDGTNDFGTTPTNLLGVSNGTNISEITIEAWVNWNTFPTSGIDEIISWWNSGSSTVGFLGTSCINNGGGTNSNPAIRFGDGWTNTGVRFTTSTDTDKWWYICAIKSTNNAYIYKNGTLEATRGSTINFTLDRPAAIGCHNGVSRRIEFIDGKIGIIRVYNRALTSSEVSQNYNAQKGRFGL